MRFEYSSYHLCSAFITRQASTTLRSATNGSTATRASSSRRANGKLDDAALLGRAHLVADVDAEALEQRLERVELARVVVVAGDQHRVDLAIPGESGHLVEGSSVLVHPRTAAERLAESHEHLDAPTTRKAVNPEVSCGPP